MTLNELRTFLQNDSADDSSPGPQDVRKLRLPAFEITETQSKDYATSVTASLAPELQRSLQRIGREADETLERLAKALLPLAAAASRLVENVRPTLDLLARLLPALVDRAFLHNWVGVDFPEDIHERIEQILLDEGIALAWVPPPETLQLLLNASSPQARRNILGRRWHSVTRSCIRELEKVSSVHHQEYRKFALDSAKALEQGHATASQALSSSLIDTMLRERYELEDRRRLNGFKRPRLLIDDLPYREALVLGGIFGAHEPYNGADGELPPRSYSRHASTHAVSRRQYSRVNAVIALMHVTALLRLLAANGSRG